MSLVFKISPKENYFSGNPIVFELQSDSEAAIDYSVQVDNNTVFQGTCIPISTTESFEIKVDISEIFKSYFKSYNIVESEDIIAEISGFNISSVITFQQGESQIEHSAHIYRGGITNRAFRTLTENGYDIFTYRLSSYWDQFLFTTRTNGKKIKVKETELFPFIFIHSGVPVGFISESGTEVLTPARATGTVCSMNIKRILEQMPAGTKRIEILIGGETSFELNILPRKFFEESYLLKFKNSLGAFEILEVTGRAMHIPEFSEESVFETITEFNFYEEYWDRTKTRNIIDVETGYKERHEFPFILDMIKSDEIYCINSDGFSFRCHVTAENAQYRNFMKEPTSIPLKIREVLEEEFSMPEIKFDSEFDQIFGDTFDETFN
jgi:hypothetical protein